MALQWEAIAAGFALSLSAASFGAHAALDTPLHVVLLPDGRVMRYGTDGQGNQTGQFNCDVWDPNQGAAAASHLTLPNTTGTEIFCMPSVTGVGLGRHHASAAVMDEGQFFVSGGPMAGF